MNTYYVWRSDERQIHTETGSSAQQAAHRFALRHRIPYNVALRVVDVEDVASFGVRLECHMKAGES